MLADVNLDLICTGSSKRQSHKILNKFVPIRAERKNPRIDSSEKCGK
jgi:hypothetical protein